MKNRKKLRGRFTEYRRETDYLTWAEKEREGIS